MVRLFTGEKYLGLDYKYMTNFGKFPPPLQVRLGRTSSKNAGKGLLLCGSTHKTLLINLIEIKVVGLARAGNYQIINANVRR